MASFESNLSPNRTHGRVSMGKNKKKNKFTAAAQLQVDNAKDRNDTLPDMILKEASHQKKAAEAKARPTCPCLRALLCVPCGEGAKCPHLIVRCNPDAPQEIMAENPSWSMNTVKGKDLPPRCTSTGPRLGSRCIHQAPARA